MGPKALCEEPTLNHTTPVLTESVPYSWEELKKGQLPMDQRVEPPMPASSTNFRFGAQVENAQAPSVRPVQTAAVPAQSASAQTCPPATADSGPSTDEKLMNEMVEALVPLILDRLHAQVSIMVDMTMKQAAAKIRNDFDNALKPTVQAAVRQVVGEKLAK